MTTYSEKLRDPRWQKRRLEILSRDGWTCFVCGDDASTLHVHHRWYEGEPWDAPDEALVTLCETCHQQESDNRREDEAELLAILRRRYLSHDLRHIAKVMLNMPFRHVVEVQLSAVAHHLSQPENIESILADYFSAKCPVLPCKPVEAQEPVA